MSHKDKVVNLSMTKRLHAGKCLTCFEAGFYLSAQTALLIATAAMLWHPKESQLEDPLKAGYENVCNEPWTRDEINGFSYPKYEDSECEKTVDIYYQWTSILQLYFAFFVIQWFRMALVFFALCTQSVSIIKLFEGLGCAQCCYGLACLIILHLYRFQPAGRAAAMDYMTMDEHKDLVKAYRDAWELTDEMPDSGQYIRGRFLLGLVIYIWVGGFFFCCFSCIIAAIHVKKYGPALAA